MALYATKSYKATTGGHEIEFEFDKTGVVVNRGRVFVDGDLVDQKLVHYGETNVRGRLPDGRDFRVDFGSGFVGQLKSLELTVAGESIPLHAAEQD
jgi:hypothetical protein